ncbi:deaminase domain-containing protein [Actinomadura parmotrematis]|uniref:Intein C-terminal splicing domain-containing protein n=1 Tax=Actinomadura parmotrematis TaxID=2864039 RepID=A0ABS7FPJ7_9ACTN|nr:deaminase domain-containing protein [Actinomadura parmotrematis]MBW8482281.1 hypothetical protein [Actinomadura parmotrematis]
MYWHFQRWEAQDVTQRIADALRRRLRTPSGSTQKVASTALLSSHPRVHDLAIADTHTFYVLAGKTPVLVHNCSPLKKIAQAYRKNANNGIGVSRRKNIAVAGHDINGQVGQNIGVSGEYAQPGSLGMVATRQFDHGTRPFDSETKIFEHYASYLPKNSEGTIDLYSELPVCPSCTDLIEQFKQMYPGIEVDITWG